jgi:peptide/nickel transport system permease protein
MPGDPVSHLMGDIRLPPNVRESLIIRFSMNKPITEQFTSYMINTLHGDFGISFSYYPSPVLDVLMQRLPWTLFLLGSSTCFSVILGVLSAVLCAWKQGQRIDVSIQTIALAFWSMPFYWLGMILLYVFGYQLGIFPIGSALSAVISYPSILAYVSDILWHAALPMITLTLGLYAQYALVMRGSMVTNLTEDYVLTAEAKGIGKHNVIWKHVGRNSLLPVVTLITLNFAYVVGGAVFVETVFGYPGVGSLIYEALEARDYPLLQGAFCVLGLAIVIANFISDLLYMILDPRIKY